MFIGPSMVRWDISVMEFPFVRRIGAQARGMRLFRAGSFQPYQQIDM
jgi:hypothetical protein